jgi:undecaprenyl-diphosphatase
MVGLFCTGRALKQFLHAAVMLLSPAPRSIPPVMNRNSTATRISGALAWLDQVELTACRRFNRVVRRNGALQLFRVASRLGDGVLWYTLIGVLALGFGAAGRQAALECAFAGVAGLLVYRYLKNVLVRERPYMTHAVIVCAGRPLDRFSFPSGHTLHAVSFTMIAASAFPSLALVLVPAAVLIALSRVVLGLHYPSDVLAGGLLGAAIARATMTLIGA